MQNQYGGRAQADKSAGPGPDDREKIDTAQMSVIGADITITGNIEASVDLHIEGKIVGDVRCATLILGESSVVEGHIHAERVRVSGAVNGSIDTRDLAIEATAKVAGEISYDRLRVANGGTLEGNVRRKPAEESAETGKLKLVEPPRPEPKPAVFIE
jgi:cytoskeletal protein CcmA (bactofilin family)